MPRLSRVPYAAAMLLLLAVPAAAAEGVSSKSTALQVSVDQARVLKIERQAETVIIGNPAIVDVTVHDSQTLVLTGRSYGITNIIILDRDGEPIVDESVEVRSFEDGTLRVFRQEQRTTYACLPQCEPTVTIGDEPSSFSAAAGQYAERQSMAAGAVK